MKLSIKFFCIAYIIVLLSTGFSGIFLINHSKSMALNEKFEFVQSTAKYAADSFKSFSDAMAAETEVSRRNITELVKNNFGGDISLVNITSKVPNDEYEKLEFNEGITKIKINTNPIVECVYKSRVNNKPFYVIVNSDLREIENHYKYLWFIYGISICMFASISGLSLYFIAGRVTKPVTVLSQTAKSIDSGNYGKTINIKSKDLEIIELANSFNSMSKTISEKISQIEDELSKRDMFVSGFTHELKTPITAIIGYSQLLNSYTLNENEKREALETIYNEGSRLEKLGRQLLDLYIYKSEEIQLNKVALTEIKDRLQSALKIVGEKYKVNFIIELHDCIVYAHKDLLLSMLYNLADNGAKASSENGLIKIYSQYSGENIKIFVEDRGRGIAAENIKFLTEPFYREDKSRSRKYGGTGLGLSICEKIAHLHNTKLSFESEINKGTTVSFELKRG